MHKKYAILFIYGTSRKDLPMETQKIISSIKNNIKKSIVGNDEAIDLMMISLFAGGHVLLEDVPGTGKTTMAKSLAKSLSCDFSRVQFEKPIEDYSGGQKKKVLLAGSLCKQAHLYIWDEPLNFIDVFSRMQLENLILQFQPTMLLVEHDKTFVENVATKVVKFG